MLHLRAWRCVPGRLSLPELMTGIAAHGCLALLMAVHAPFHLQGLLKIYDLPRGDIAVTLHTFDIRGGMRTMAEEDKSGQFVDELERDLPVGEIRVAGLTLRQHREARPITALGLLVAECTLLLQRRVLLVIERPVVAPQNHAPQTQGKE